MLFILIISITLNIYLGWLAWDIYSRYMEELYSHEEYPIYYKTVMITYKLPNKETKSECAWLSVNDSGDMIWTLTDDVTIIPDEYILNWYYL